MTSIALWYRGVYLERHRPQGQWSHYSEYNGQWWGAGGNPDRLMLWNDALAWIDSVADETEEPGLDGSYSGPPFFCSDCGDRDLLHWVKKARDELLRRGLCFSCNHWRAIAENVKCRPRQDFIAGGKAYHISPDSSGGGFKGFGGSKFVIVWPDGTTTESRNLWHLGEVPLQWRSRLPDTAVFKH